MRFITRPVRRANPILTSTLTSWGLARSEELHTLMEQFRTDTAQGNPEKAVETLNKIVDKARAIEAALRSSMED